jgi:hypothetical protein
LIEGREWKVPLRCPMEKCNKKQDMCVHDVMELTVVVLLTIARSVLLLQ